MNHDHHELYNLHRCQVLLPPNIFLEPGSHGRHHVIEVHPDVHEGVQEPEEGAVTAGCKLDTYPGAEGHYTVMNHVQ